MVFKRMELEDWFDRYQFEFEFDIGESGVKFFKFKDLSVDLENVELRYGNHKGDPELREMISSFFPGLSLSNIAVTNGSSEAIFSVIASLIGPGDHVIVEAPNYPSLYEIPLSLERNVSLYFLEFEEGFRLNLEKLSKLIRPETRLICLTHQNNPTGSVLSRKELEELISFIESNNLFLLMDETYREISLGEPLPLAATLSNKAISVSSMSKAFGVPGIRMGWVAAQEEIIDSVRAVREQITICNSSISERIALAILSKKEEMKNKIKLRINNNLLIMDAWIKARNDLEWIYPSGGVVGFPRLIEDVDSEDLCRLLMEKYRTFVVPGFCFKMPRHIRLGFGGEEEEVRIGLDRLGMALDNWRKK